MNKENIYKFTFKLDIDIDIDININTSESDLRKQLLKQVAKRLQRDLNP